MIRFLKRLQQPLPTFQSIGLVTTIPLLIQFIIWLFDKTYPIKSYLIPVTIGVLVITGILGSTTAVIFSIYNKIRKKDIVDYKIEIIDLPEDLEFEEKYSFQRRAWRNAIYFELLIVISFLMLTIVIVSTN
ncbi:MAG: hypothetical protein R2753_05775 [Chitinophagales bacterium]